MRVTQEPEGLHPQRVALGGLVLGVLSAVSIGVAWFVLTPTPGALERGSPRPAATFGEPAHIETSLFSPGTMPSSQTAARVRLGQYGWVNRAAGVVHVPIERAMELYLHQADASAPRAAPEPGAEP